MAWTQAGPGRPKGRKSSATIFRQEAAREFAAKVVNDPDYQASLLERAKKGTLPPQVETAIFYYAFGKPVERVEVEDTTPNIRPEEMTEEQLEQRALRLAAAMADARIRRAEEEAAENNAAAPVVSPEPKSVM